MKRLHAEEGLKINPVYLLNNITDINEINFREIASQLFTPGLFISKNENGTLDTEFSTQLVAPYTSGGTNYQSIKISNSTFGEPARAFTRTGKIISLYTPFTITPYKMSTSAGSYGLYIKPISTTREYADYLPNYTVGNKPKSLVEEYMVDFQIIKEGLSVPEDCIKIATFTMTVTNGESTYGVITNLVDKRNENRAYLNRELYDFFASDYLKHDYVIAPGTWNVGAHTGKINYSNGEVLSGTLTLFSNKNPNSRVDVIFDGSTYPALTFSDTTADYVLFIDLGADAFNSGDIIVRPLQYNRAENYIPTKDQVVVGIRSRNSVPTSIGGET